LTEYGPVDSLVNGRQHVLNEALEHVIRGVYIGKDWRRHRDICAIGSALQH
jgi:hypothetical protein